MSESTNKGSKGSFVISLLIEGVSFNVPEQGEGKLDKLDFQIKHEVENSTEVVQELCMMAKDLFRSFEASADAFRKSKDQQGPLGL